MRKLHSRIFAITEPDNNDNNNNEPQPLHSKNVNTYKIYSHSNIRTAKNQWCELVTQSDITSQLYYNSVVLAVINFKTTYSYWCVRCMVCNIHATERRIFIFMSWFFSA